MSAREFYKNIEFTVDDKLIINNVTNTTENIVSNQYNFYKNINTNGFGTSEGTGTSLVEIIPGNQYEFFKRIKLDDNGNIKIKQK
jgi:hypothetical protein